MQHPLTLFTITAKPHIQRHQIVNAAAWLSSFSLGPSVVGVAPPPPLSVLVKLLLLSKAGGVQADTFVACIPFPGPAVVGVVSRPPSPMLVLLSCVSDHLSTHSHSNKHSLSQVAPSSLLRPVSGGRGGP